MGRAVLVRKEDIEPVQVKVLPRQPDPHGGFDARRNTSRVFQPEPGAVGEAQRALRTIDPRLRKWIEEGHPTLTEDEHYRRFGETYKGTATKKGAR